MPSETRLHGTLTTGNGPPWANNLRPVLMRRPVNTLQSKSPSSDIWLFYFEYLNPKFLRLCPNKLNRIPKYTVFSLIAQIIAYLIRFDLTKGDKSYDEQLLDVSKFILGNSMVPLEPEQAKDKAAELLKLIEQSSNKELESLLQ